MQLVSLRPDPDGSSKDQLLRRKRNKASPHSLESTLDELILVSDGLVFNEVPKDETKRKFFVHNYENYNCWRSSFNPPRSRRDLFGNQMRSEADFFCILIHIHEVTGKERQILKLFLNKNEYFHLY